MRPAEVLDHQASLGDFLDSRYYHQYIDNFLSDMQRKGKIVSGITGADMCGTLARSLRIANAFHVQAEMMPVLRTGSMDLADEDHLVHARLPAEHGWLMFEDPWTSIDVWGDQMLFNAIQWRHGSAEMGDGHRAGRTVPGIWLTSYTDIEDVRDESNVRVVASHGIEELRKAGRWHVNHLWFLAYEESVGVIEYPVPEEYARFAQTGRPPTTTHVNPNRMVVALFRLLNQVFVEVKDHPLDRSAMRKAKRANLPARVQVIKLRRKETKYLNPSEGGGSDVEWQHSWWVRGTWQWRKCSAEHPAAEEYEYGYHARVYVRPFIKGPADKPMLITEKVWDLSR